MPTADVAAGSKHRGRALQQSFNAVFVNSGLLSLTIFLKGTEIQLINSVY